MIRNVGVMAMLAFAAALAPSGIWKGVAAPVVVREMIDGVIDRLITAAMFAWLWPRPDIALAGLTG